MGEVRRRGDVEKCPACGWRLDADAYRCPKCLIYFCYVCRARVGELDSQYQCDDQSCDCYGKLLCAACVVTVPLTFTTPKEVVEPDATLAVLVIGAAVGGVALCVAPILAAAFFGIVAAVVSGIVYREQGLNLWGSADRKHTKTESRSTTYICCMQCRRYAKVLRN